MKKTLNQVKNDRKFLQSEEKKASEPNSKFNEGKLSRPELLRLTSDQQSLYVKKELQKKYKLEEALNYQCTHCAINLLYCGTSHGKSRIDISDDELSVIYHKHHK